MPTPTQAVPASLSTSGGSSSESDVGGETFFVKALYDHTAEDSDEISFDVGDIIQVIQEDDSGWWVGVNLTAQKQQQKPQPQGMFPAVYVTRL
jgi:hypothetical protein